MMLHAALCLLASPRFLHTVHMAPVLSVFQQHRRPLLCCVSAEGCPLIISLCTYLYIMLHAAVFLRANPRVLHAVHMAFIQAVC
jgi:hypothetical protein